MLLTSLSCFIALWKHTCRPIKTHVQSKLFFDFISYTSLNAYEIGRNVVGPNVVCPFARHVCTCPWALTHTLKKDMHKTNINPLVLNASFCLKWKIKRRRTISQQLGGMFNCPSKLFYYLSSTNFFLRLGLLKAFVKNLKIGWGKVLATCTSC